MSFTSRSQCTCLALFLFLAPASGIPRQSAVPPASQPPSQEPALTPRPAPAPDSGEGRIRLDVVVSDKSGKLVTGLEPTDFTLLDNGQPGKILSFHAVDTVAEKRDAPVQAILVPDAANLEFSAVAREREEIDKFLRSNSGHLAIPVSVFLASDDGVKMLAQPSLDGNAVAAQLDQANAGLRSITRSSGASGAIERLQLLVRSLDSLVRAVSAKPGRKLMVWIGDGWPLLDEPGFTSSSSGDQVMFDEIVHTSGSLREARITLYSVSEGFSGPRTYLYQSFLKGVKSSKHANPGNLSVKVFATQSGGRVLTPATTLPGSLPVALKTPSPTTPCPSIGRAQRIQMSITT